MIPRACGILLPVTSLPSRFGTGCFDRAAYEFIDWLAEAGQHVWQILPIGPTGYGDSPYQAFSTFAGNPYFISLEELIDAGWLTEQECMDALPDTDPRHVDYEVQYVHRMALLRTAFERSDLCLTEKFRVFCEENADWLDDYALFMAIKNARFGQDWTAWEHELAMREPAAITAARKQYAEDIRFYEFLQCLFFDQLQRLLAYAHSKEIYLIGDIPIYVAPDSADAWADPQLFQLDENHKPTDISGCRRTHSRWTDSSGAIPCTAGRSMRPRTLHGGSAGSGTALRPVTSSASIISGDLTSIIPYRQDPRLPQPATGKRGRG